MVEEDPQPGRCRSRVYNTILTLEGWRQPMADSEHVPLRVAAGRVASLPSQYLTAFCTDSPASEQAAVIANAVRHTPVVCTNVL